MPYQSDPKAQMRTAATMDTFSPWTQMMLAQQGGHPAPPPFVPVPVPVPMPPPASSDTADPLPRSDMELLKQLLKPTNQGWRHGR